MSVNNVLNTAQGASEVLHRRVLKHQAASGLADIYNADLNAVIWQRRLSEEVRQNCRALLGVSRFAGVSITLPVCRSGALVDAMPELRPYASLTDDIALLIDMFATLFEVGRVGLRLMPLRGQMCPRFHVDRVPCRMLSTYVGAGTQWLPQHCVDRSKLGAGSGGLKDSESGLFADSGHIESMAEGDVALLKGEMWEGNEGAGLVHRSPLVAEHSPRLLLSIDLA